ncbi:hypothetical protein TNCV_478911 [Trichonephila clavipes]|nr:hypothetical protein TNCV_478911 [Trichonephila clavipes]
MAFTYTALTVLGTSRVKSTIDLSCVLLRYMTGKQTAVPRLLSGHLKSFLQRNKIFTLWGKCYIDQSTPKLLFSFLGLVTKCALLVLDILNIVELLDLLSSLDRPERKDQQICHNVYC